MVTVSRDLFSMAKRTLPLSDQLAAPVILIAGVFPALILGFNAVILRRFRLRLSPFCGCRVSSFVARAKEGLAGPAGMLMQRAIEREQVVAITPLRL